MYGDAHKQLVDSGDWREHIDLHTHRYVTEDTVLGLAFLASVARWCGVDAPIAHGLLAMAGGFLGRDLRHGPRTLEALGLAGLDRAALQQRLHDGDDSARSTATMAALRRASAPAAWAAASRSPSPTPATAIALIDLRRARRRRRGAAARRGASPRSAPASTASPSSARCDAGAIDAIAARVQMGRRRGCARRARRRRLIFEGVPETLEAKREALAADRPPLPRRRDRDLDDEQHPRHPARAAGRTHPERFLNLHWLNPAYLIPVVELSVARRHRAPTRWSARRR